MGEKVAQGEDTILPANIPGFASCQRLLERATKYDDMKFN